MISSTVPVVCDALVAGTLVAHAETLQFLQARRRSLFMIRLELLRHAFTFLFPLPPSTLFTPTSDEVQRSVPNDLSYDPTSFNHVSSLFLDLGSSCITSWLSLLSKPAVSMYTLLYGLWISNVHTHVPFWILLEIQLFRKHAPRYFS